METEFWHQRWSEDKIGFHQENINSRLVKLWPTLDADHQHPVLVPLCGKSGDMLWLMKQGYNVFGVEVSAIACEDFFSENNLTCEVTQQKQFKIFHGQGIELWSGDFFDLQPEDLAQVRAVYDRAALIELPAKMCSDYAKHLSFLLNPGTIVMLITMEYDQIKMQGPPFSVVESEVQQLYVNDFEIQQIAQSSGPEILGNLKKRGLDTLTEKIFLLKKNPI